MENFESMLKSISVLSMKSKTQSINIPVENTKFCLTKAVKVINSLAFKIFILLKSSLENILMLSLLVSRRGLEREQKLYR